MPTPDPDPFITLPPAYRAMPRWWHDSTGWLDALPDTVRDLCARWHLTRDGPVMHGSNALVVPVRRRHEPLVLRVTPPDARFPDELAALRFWNGRGTVHLLDADPGAGASLLERLDNDRSLAGLPLDEAVPIIAWVMRRLAVPAPPETPSTADIVRERGATLEPDWVRLGHPFSREVLDAAIAAARALGMPGSSCPLLAVNGDLHFAQVLAGTREPWLVVDPVLLRGDIAYDLARILWSRLDEMPDDADIRRHIATIVREADLDRDQALAWILYRTVDYWLWGLDYGLTEDPVRCARLVHVLRQP